MLPLLLLSGCDLLQLVSPSPQPPPPAPIRQTLEKPILDTDAGLQPLPSPQQVVSGSSLGRRNPFAPVVVPAIPLPPGVEPGSEPALAVARVVKAGGSAVAQQLALKAALKAQAEAEAKAEKGARGTPGAVAGPNRPLGLQAPLNLQLTGVIQTHGQTEAVVTYGGQSGSLRPGDRGGRTTGLLPAGWSVVAIHLGGHGQEDVPSLLLQQGRQRVKVKL